MSKMIKASKLYLHNWKKDRSERQSRKKTGHEGWSWVGIKVETMISSF